MFGFSLIRTSKLTAVYEWLAKFASEKIKNQNTLSMEIKGKVIINLGVQSGTSKAGKAWSKASVVIETEGQYPKKVLLDNMKNADEFGRLAVGSIGTFHLNVESREFNGRWYSSVNCYKWEVSSPYPQQAPPAAQPYPGAPQPQAYPPNAQPYNPQYAQNAQMAPAEGSDDLPF